MAKREAASSHPPTWLGAVNVRDRFVGREQQLSDLWERLERALDGQGQVAFVRGQAGAGKTALVHHFLRRALALQPELAIAIGSCNAQTGIGDPYLPVREALLMLTDASTGRRAEVLGSAAKAGPTQTVLVRSVQVLVDVAPDLIGLFVPGAGIAAKVGKAAAEKTGLMDKLDEQVKPGEKRAPDQGRIFEQFTAYVRRLSSQVPLVLFMDDLQWADSASLQLFFHLARRIEGHRVILIGAYRPSDVALGRSGERHQLVPIVHELQRTYGDIVIDLDRLPEPVARHFMDALIDAEPNHLDAAFRDALYQHTAGHALYTVELLETMRDRGVLAVEADGAWAVAGRIDWQALPARIEGVIAERIGRLDEELRDMLTIAAVEGEQFTAEVVARVQAMAEREAVRQLSRELSEAHRLVSPQGVARIGAQRLSLYRFLHSLFQQYLYGSMTEAERVYLHLDVGEVLEELFAGHTDEIAAQLARHFEEAGSPAKAAGYRLQAAQRALRLSAHREAFEHAERGLALLAALPRSAEGLALEVGLQITRGVASVGSFGYAATQSEQAFSRGRELAAQLGHPLYEAAALYGLCGVTFVHAEFARTRTLGQELVAIARRADVPGFVLGGHVILGASEMYLGHLQRARESLEEVIALYDPTAHRDLAYDLTQDPAVAAQAFLSWVLWQMGYPEQAIAVSDRALAWAHDLDHPYSLGFALSFAATLNQKLRRPDAALQLAERTVALGEKEGFPTWQAMGRMARGWARAQQGEIDEGIADLLQGLAIWDAAGAVLGKHFFNTNLAELYGIAGRAEEGLHVLDEADWSGEAVWWLSEQRRIRGGLCLHLNRTREGEALLHEAIDVAEGQENRAAALRAASDLARVLQGRGEMTEARTLLAPQVAAFTEGFDLPDLQDARALLASLSTEPAL